MNSNNFCDTLEGFYDNWKQAASNPTKYAHCYIRWKRIGDNELTSTQWYQHEGEDKPYRHRWHRVTNQLNRISYTCLVENWSPDWKEHNSCCDMIFTKEEDFFIGKVLTDKCIVNGGIVKSMVELDGKTYRSRDQGWKDGQVVWGDDVIYEFDKL